MPKGSICCCGARAWTRFIGWIDLINALLKFVPLVAALVQPTAWKDHGSVVIATILETLGINYFLDTADSAKLYLLGWVLASLAFLQIPLAVILLIGSYKTRPAFLKFWIITVATFLTVIALVGLVQVIIFNEGVEIFQKVLVILLGVCLEGFCVWVVSLHEKEMSGEGERDGNYGENF